MLVAIDMIKRQSGSRKGFELCSNFAGDLPARCRIGKYPDAGRTMPLRKRPELSTRSGSFDGGNSGRPSVRTMCRPTRSDGSRRARSTASVAAGAPTIRLAAVRMPFR